MASDFEQRNMTGSLFKNERKTADNQPAYTGVVNVEGKLWRLAAWLKTARSGKTYMSLSVSEMNSEQQTNDSVPDDDIPF